MTDEDIKSVIGGEYDLQNQGGKLLKPEEPRGEKEPPKEEKKEEMNPLFKSEL